MLSPDQQTQSEETIEPTQEIATTGIYRNLTPEQIAEHQMQQDAYLSDRRNNRSHRYNGTDLRPVFTDGPGNERGR